MRIWRILAPLAFVVRERGALEVRETDPGQSWFWTPEWQEGEHEVDVEIAAGQGKIFCSDQEFLEHLDTIAAEELRNAPRS